MRCVLERADVDDIDPDQYALASERCPLITVLHVFIYLRMLDDVVVDHNTARSVCVHHWFENAMTDDAPLVMTNEECVYPY